MRLLCYENLGLGNILALLVVRLREYEERSYEKYLGFTVTIDCHFCLQLGMGMGRWPGNHVLRCSPTCWRK